MEGIRSGTEGISPDVIDRDEGVDVMFGVSIPLSLSMTSGARSPAEAPMEPLMGRISLGQQAVVGPEQSQRDQRDQKKVQSIACALVSEQQPRATCTSYPTRSVWPSRDSSMCTL